jgi:hypothetical protein
MKRVLTAPILITFFSYEKTKNRKNSRKKNRPFVGSGSLGCIGFIGFKFYVRTGRRILTSAMVLLMVKQLVTI